MPLHYYSLLLMLKNQRGGERIETVYISPCLHANTIALYILLIFHVDILTITKDVSCTGAHRAYG